MRKTAAVPAGIKECTQNVVYENCILSLIAPAAVKKYSKNECAYIIVTPLFTNRILKKVESRGLTLKQK